MQWSSFCKPCDKSPPDQVVDIANLSQRWFRRMFSLSASPHGKSFNHIWWIFLTEQKSVKISFKNPRGWIFFCFHYFLVINLPFWLTTNKSYFLFPQWIFASENFSLGDFCPKRTPWTRMNVQEMSLHTWPKVLIYQTLTTWAFCLQKCDDTDMKQQFIREFFAPN